MNNVISTRSESGRYLYRAQIADATYEACIAFTHEGMWSMSIEDCNGRQQYYWVFDKKSQALKYLKDYLTL
jgi:hypothetical protein